MPIEQIPTFLVHPNKGGTETKGIGGAKLPLEGKLFALLSNIYEKSERECEIDISFDKGDDGKQINACRTLITGYVAEQTLPKARKIAERLAGFTTHRSRLGLLFLIVGKEGADHKIVVSRFPADTGVLAEEKRETLSVAFLERVFMKNATLACTRFRRHRVRCFDGTGGGSWRGGSSRGSSSLKRCA